MTDDDGDRLAALDDDALLARLATTIGGAEEPPADVVALARLSFGLRRLDEELADLVADSAADPAAAGVRAGSTGSRWLTFEAPSGELELELVPDGDGWDVIGQVVPPGPADIRLEPAAAGGGATAVDAVGDELGVFRLRAPAGGAWRLVCRRQGHPDLVSAWILLG